MQIRGSSNESYGYVVCKAVAVVVLIYVKLVMLLSAFPSIVIRTVLINGGISLSFHGSNHVPTSFISVMRIAVAFIIHAIFNDYFMAV